MFLSIAPSSIIIMIGRSIFGLLYGRLFFWLFETYYITKISGLYSLNIRIVVIEKEKAVL
jgi:hypothetical protein